MSTCTHKIIKQNCVSFTIFVWVLPRGLEAKLHQPLAGQPVSSLWSGNPNNAFPSLSSQNRNRLFPEIQPPGKHTNLKIASFRSIPLGVCCISFVLYVTTDSKYCKPSNLKVCRTHMDTVRITLEIKRVQFQLTITIEIMTFHQNWHL